MRYAAPSGVIALALVLSACDSGTTIIVNPGHPSAQPQLAASIGAPPSGYAFVGGPGSYAAPPFDLSVFTSTSGNLHSVTIHLLDGSNVGGPAFTYAQPGLSSQFGTTYIHAGTTRLFRFDLPVAAWTPRPRRVGADIVVIDDHGGTHNGSVQREWP